MTNWRCQRESGFIKVVQNVFKLTVSVTRIKQAGVQLQTWIRGWTLHRPGMEPQSISEDVSMTEQETSSHQILLKCKELP